MKKRRFLALAVMLGVGIIIWFLRPYGTSPTVSQGPTANSPSNPSQQSAANDSLSPTPKAQQTPPQPTTVPKPSVSNPVGDYVRNIKADPQFDWKQPINFYG